MNIAHFLSVITLYYLTLVVEGKKEHSKLAFVAAFLHVLTPAGIFLCAPYAEGFFSFANFLGMLLYASYYMSTKQTGDLSLKQGTLVILSGVSFGLAAATRTNGVLSGMLFASDFFISLRGFVSSRRSRYLGYMAVSVLAGLLTSAGLVIPQALAYKLYCVNSPSGLLTRPWCKSLPPSIYSWVQSYYWYAIESVFSTSQGSLQQGSRLSTILDPSKPPIVLPCCTNAAHSSVDCARNV